MATVRYGWEMPAECRVVVVFCRYVHCALWLGDTHSMLRSSRILQICPLSALAGKLPAGRTVRYGAISTYGAHVIPAIAKWCGIGPLTPTPPHPPLRQGDRRK